MEPTKSVGILLMQSTIEDVITAVKAAESVCANYKHINVRLFVHPHVIESGLINVSRGCCLTSYKLFSKFKSRGFNHIINGSPILATASTYEEKMVALYESMLDFLYEVVKPIVVDTFAVSKQIVWTSVFNPCDGYGSSAEQMIMALDNVQDWSVVFKPHRLQSLHLAQPSSYKIYNRSKAYTLRGFVDAHYLYYAQPHEVPLQQVYKGYKVNFTMWESSRVPGSWPSAMKNYDMVFTPSEWGKQAMQQCGVSTPIHVVPLGVNTNIFTYKKKKPRKGKFKFLLYANSHWENERKNYQQTCDAFAKVFCNNNDVELVLKLTEGNKPKVKCNNIKPIYGRLAPSTLNELLHDCDCFIFVSSGEGFGLPPREALATGTPTIIGNTSALQDVAKPEFCVPVQPTGKKVPRDYPGIYGKPKSLGYLDTYNVLDICDSMLHVYNNYSDCIEVAEYASQHIQQNMTYKNTAQRITEILV